MSGRAELEQELIALDARIHELSRRISDAQNRQRYCRDQRIVDEARAGEAALLRELDRTMTRHRAVEGKLLLLQTGRKRPF